MKVRFTLRVTLIAVAFLAVACGYVAHRFRVAKVERQAWNMIADRSDRLAGWPAEIDSEDRYKAETQCELRRVFEDYVDTFVFCPTVYLKTRLLPQSKDDSGNRNSIPKAIEGFPFLRFLVLDRGSIDESDIGSVKALGSLKELQFVRADFSRVTNDDKLTISTDSISFLRCSSPHPNLPFSVASKRLRISRPTTADFTPAVFRSIEPVQIDILNVRYDNGFSERQLLLLGDCKLRKLAIAYCDNFSAKGLDEIPCLSALEGLSVAQPNVMFSELGEIDALSTLETLDMHLLRFEPEMVLSVNRMPQLSKLGIKFRESMSDGEALALCQLQRIKVLSMGKCSKLQPATVLKLCDSLPLETMVFQDRVSYSKFSPHVVKHYPKLECRLEERPIGLSRWSILGL